jgi:hypothetical protein
MFTAACIDFIVNSSMHIALGLKLSKSNCWPSNIRFLIVTENLDVLVGKELAFKQSTFVCSYRSDIRERFW